MLCYLHIPFCDSKCHYCAFNSYVDRFEMREAYMRAAVRQLRHDLARFRVQPGQVETLFIGGGTPSTVRPGLYAPFFETLRPYLAKNAEITTEANPNSATEAWLRGMRALGINRVSFGVQSFFEEKLRFLGRAHRAKEAVEAVERAHACGFSRISVDLIYATALDTPRRLEQELERAFSLPIDHFSAYELTIEEGTLFQNRPEVRKESLEQSRLVAQRAAAAGFAPYEISNFGRPCRHNLGYWRYEPYLGIGCGAVGRIRSVRYAPHTLPERYIEDPLYRQEEPLTQEQMLQERIFLGARSIVGIDAAELPEAMRRRADLLVEEGKLFFEGGRLRNPDFLLADEIALFILD
ncbi:radical SAM family heme chaperone HemW [Hydrogenimonas sp. SS33]|uniref:radical SAM family heme chaperone HemW n=1 Tax=Hydrogenimonas leucolamina TaxID=2954236 RepID=UPI00336C18A7